MSQISLVSLKKSFVTLFLHQCDKNLLKNCTVNIFLHSIILPRLLNHNMSVGIERSSEIRDCT